MHTNGQLTCLLAARRAEGDHLCRKSGEGAEDAVHVTDKARLSVQHKRLPFLRTVTPHATCSDAALQRTMHSMQRTTCDMQHSPRGMQHATCLERDRFASLE